MKQFNVSFYFENDEDEIDFVTLGFDSENLDSLLTRLDKGDYGDYEPDEITDLDGITDWDFFYIEDSDGNEVFCDDDDYRDIMQS